MVIPDNRQGQHLGVDRGYANVTPLNCIRAKVPERRRFIKKEQPYYNPHTIRYKKYWTEEIRRNIEGLWVKHDTGFMWTPALLYFYGNYATILLQKHKRDKRKIKSRPLIRDLEWQVGRYWTICRGFSGFDGDELCSCDLRLSPRYEGNDLPLRIEDISDPRDIHLFKPNGTHKEYMPEYDYIRRTFSKPVGKALYLNEARDFMWLGSRGGGKSYFTGAIIAHEFTFNGAKEFTEESILNPSPIDIVVGAAEKKKSRELLKKTRICLDNLPGEYKKGDIYFPSPLAKSRLSGSWEEEVSHSYQVKRGGSWKTEGSMSRILHVAYKDNAEAAAGTRASVMVFEEVGLSTNLIDVYAANVDVMMNEAYKFGSMLYLGTSGNMEKIKHAEQIFRSPASYSVYAIYDSATDRDIGFFMPYHMTATDYKDENGITDLENAIKSEEKKRNTLKNDPTLDSLAYHKYTINRPEKWQEMFISNRDNGLPVAEINERLEQLDKGKYFELVNKAYHLRYDDDGDYGVSWEVDVDKLLKPLLSAKDDTNAESIDGAVVVYEEPLYVDGKVPNDLYIFGHDTYVSENRESGGSLGAFYVMRQDKYLIEAPSQKRIVAQYVGKPSGGLDTYYENALKLMYMYNCGDGNFFFESNRSQHCKNFMVRKHARYMMNVKPSMFSKKDDPVTKSVHVEYGIPMSSQMKADGIRLIRDYLLEEVDRVKVEEEDGHVRTKIVRVVHTIDDRALLQEMSIFDPMKGNYDRFMGFMIAVIGRTVNKYEVEKRTRLDNTRNPLASLLNNRFFNDRKLKDRKVNRNGKTIPTTISTNFNGG